MRPPTNLTPETFTSALDVTFQVDAFPAEQFHGRVSTVRLNATTVQNVVTYSTIIDFDNPDEKLFPGETAYVTIPTGQVENVIDDSECGAFVRSGYAVCGFAETLYATTKFLAQPLLRTLAELKSFGPNGRRQAEANRDQGRHH